MEKIVSTTLYTAIKIAKARSTEPSVDVGSIILRENRKAVKVARKVWRQARKTELNNNLASMRFISYFKGLQHFGVTDFLQKTIKPIRRLRKIRITKTPKICFNKESPFSSRACSPNIGRMKCF
jgi:hypothetical protein